MCKSWFNVFYSNRYLNCIYKAILLKYFQNSMCDLKEKWKKNLNLTLFLQSFFIYNSSEDWPLISQWHTFYWLNEDTFLHLSTMISVKPISVKPMLRKQYGLCLKIFVDSGKYYLLRYYGPSAFFKEYFCHWDVLGNSVLCHLRHLAPPLA